MSQVAQSIQRLELDRLNDATFLRSQLQQHQNVKMPPTIVVTYCMELITKHNTLIVVYNNPIFKMGLDRMDENIAF